MIDLTPYLNILGLPPDATWDQVEQRYRTLVIFWHPDRVSSPHHKALAEEELKKINNAKDKLKEHWRDWQNRHTSSSDNSSQTDQDNPRENQDRGNQNKHQRKPNEGARQNRPNERKEKKQSQKEQADFNAAYEHYKNSQRTNAETKQKEISHASQLTRTALLSSIGMIAIAVGSAAIASLWVSVLVNKQDDWSIGKKDQHLSSRYLDFKRQSLRKISDSPGYNSFAPPMPPPEPTSLQP